MGASLGNLLLSGRKGKRRIVTGWTLSAMNHLAQAWLRTAGAVGARGDVAGAGAGLIIRWSEPHRRYHDVAHLDAVLRRVDELAAVEVDLVCLGAWFYDAVYDPTSADNEARSALLAHKVLTGLRVDNAVVSEVARLVTLTTTHAPVPDDQSGAVLCDADLAVLAGDDAGYGRYTDAVRAEYAHLDDATFTAGRARILRSLLDRPALFSTEHGRTAWEAAARDNVRRELAALEA